MTAPDILGFIWRDLVNRRVALDVVAGVATFAIATAISALSAAFLASATEIIDVAIKPTQTSAGILRVESGGQFTVSELARLRQELGALERAGRIAAVSPVVDEIESRIFELLTPAKARLRGTTRIWSVPHDAPLLLPDYGAAYLVGGPFGNGGEGPDCGPNGAAGTPRNRAAEFRPRLGVILNKSFAARLYGQNAVQFDDRLKQGSIDPREIDVIDIALHVRAGDSHGLPEKIRVALCVSGIIDEPTYAADLIFTEGLARAYFLGGRRLPARYLARFDQWENGQPLIGPEFPARTSGYWPATAPDFDYLELRNAGWEPYGLLVLAVRDWKRAGEREDIQRMLLRPVPMGGVEGEDAARLVEWARNATSPPPVADRHAAEPQSEARRRLKRLLLEALRPRAADFDLTDAMQINAVGDEEATDFTVEDKETRAFVEISYDPTRRRASFRLAPPWVVEAPFQDLATALLRLQGVIDTYGVIMFWVVLLLAASAALLLAFSHLLRKRRDIGLLLANGASRSTVFSIYIGQIMLMAVFGWSLGVVLSFVLAPALETAAAETLRRFMESATEAGVFRSAKVLKLHDFVFCRAFLWVIPPALLGAVYPVCDATRVDPLSSIGEGGG